MIDRKKALSVRLALIGLGLAGPCAHASTKYWEYPVDGDYTDAAKWNPASVPTSKDDAWCQSGASGYTINFDPALPNQASDRLIIDDDLVALALAGKTYKLGWGDSGHSSLKMGISANATPRLVISGGTVTSSVAAIGASDGSVASVGLTGSDSHWYVENSATGKLSVGCGGDGNVKVVSGAEIRADSVLLGSYDGFERRADRKRHEW